MFPQLGLCFSQKGLEKKVISVTWHPDYESVGKIGNIVVGPNLRYLDVEPPPSKNLQQNTYFQQKSTTVVICFNFDFFRAKYIHLDLKVKPRPQDSLQFCLSSTKPE